MYNNELYNYIHKGDIQNSILISTKLILNDKHNKNFELIENTFIAICSYIGTFISIYDIRLWIDVVEETHLFINSDKIIIKNIYILITKLCIVCDIYMKNPISKSGILTINKLREKIIDIFSENINLNYYYIDKFDTVLPPNNSETYDLSKLIIQGIIKIINSIENIGDDFDKLNKIANKLRDIFDYLSRKTYKFETKFQNSDNDSIWFLWGILNILYEENFIKIAYELFMTNYVKKLKTERLGIIWGMTICLIYLKKKNIARVWNKNEIILIKKVNEVGMDLYNDIKKKFCIDNKDYRDNDNDNININNNIDGLEYLINYIPQINNNNLELEYKLENTVNNETDDNIKKIKYNKK